MFIFAGLGLKRMLAQAKLDPASICDFTAMTFVLGSFQRWGLLSPTSHHRRECRDRCPPYFVFIVLKRRKHFA